MDWDKASEELRKKLDPAHVKARKQGGTQVAYVEGWHAIAEANRIFGFGAWNRETVELRQLGDARLVDGKTRVDYMARVRITVAGVVRDGCGFGQGIDRDMGQAHESALKEAETDAMKRALMTFGNPFGLALYDKTRENVGRDGPEPQPATRPVVPGEPSEDDDAPPPFDPAGCHQRLLNGIAARKTKQQLTEFWESERSALAALKHYDPAFFDAIKAAFRKAGETAINDPALQAPHPEGRNAA